MSVFAELHQHLPSRAGLAEILRAVCGRIEVQLRMAPHERDHLIHPRPAPEAADDCQLGEVDGDLVEVPRVAEVVRPAGRIFQAVDRLITNFHVPRSTLPMLAQLPRSRDRSADISAGYAACE